MADNLGRAVLETATDNSGLDRGLADAKRKSEGFVRDTARTLQGIGRSMQATGRELTASVTLPVVGLGFAVTKVGEDFDTTLRQIVGLTDITSAEIGGVREELLALSKVVGKTPQELAEAFYFIASAGFTGQEALDVLTMAAKAAASGLGQTAEVAKVLGIAVNAYGKENLTATQAVDALIAAINIGIAEAPEFASSLGLVLGSASQIGAEFPQVAAAIALMTKEGLSASEAAVALNQVFMQLFKPSKQAAEALKAVGLSAADLRRMIAEEGLLATLKVLAERLGDDEEAIGAVFGNVRAMRAILALTGGDLEETSRLFDQVADSAGSAARAFAETEGPGRAMGRAVADLHALLIDLSEDVLPVVVEVLQVAVGILGEVASAFKSLPAPVRSGIVVLLGVAAAVGPLVLVLGTLVSTLGTVLLAYGKLTTFLTTRAIPALLGTSAATTTAGASAATASGSLLALGAAIAAVYAISQQFDLGKGEGAIAEFERGRQEALRGTVEAVDAVTAANRLAAEDFGSAWRVAFRATEREALTVPPGVAESFAEGRSLTAAAVKQMLGSLHEEAVKAREAAVAEAVATPHEIAQALLAGRFSVKEAMEAINEVAETTLTRQEEIAEIKGFLTSKALAKGLRDKRPEVRAIWRAYQTDAEERLFALEQKVPEYALRTGQAYPDALASKRRYLDAKSREYLSGAVHYMSKTVPGQADTWGRKTGTEYADGLASTIDAMKKAAKYAVSGIVEVLKTLSPPGPASPLHEIDTWGRKTGEAFVKPMVDAIRGGRRGVSSALSDIAGAFEQPILPARMRLALAVPTTPYARPASDIGGAAFARAGGDTFVTNNNVSVQGLVRARDPFEIADQLRRLGEFGVLAPRRPANA